MEFEWDEAKSDACLGLRGFDFAFASRVFDDPARLVERDLRIDYREARYVAIGKIDRRVFVIVYTPLAAYLVEVFPPHIRYTSISLPYNLGNGWFGGFLPLIATALVASTGNQLAWLAYPLAVVAVTLVVGAFFLSESRGQSH